MPGNYQLSIDEAIKECEEAKSLGIGGVLLFGIPEHKDEMASGGYDPHGIVQEALGVAVDVSLFEPLEVVEGVADIRMPAPLRFLHQ